MKMLSEKVQQEYDWLTKAAGAVPLADRTLLEITGADRAVLLHNLTTADVRKLQPGEGTEAFFTDASGKILAYVYLFAEADRMVLETIAEQGEMLASYLDRYIFREDVQPADRTSQWSEWLIAGPEAEEVIRNLTGQEPPQKVLAHLLMEMKNVAIPVTVRKVDWTAAGGFLVQFESDQAEAVQAAITRCLEQVGGGICSKEAYEIARVEAGTPEYGKDITHDNLPQEIARDAKAISFTKGCYIGQETVARIDALGHVNRTLHQVRFDGEQIPEAGTELTSEGKSAGKVTSAVYSPQFQSPLALTFVRRGHEQSGTQLDSAARQAEVV